MDEFQTTFLEYVEKIEQLMISIADVSKGTSVTEADQSVGSERDKRWDHHRIRNSRGCWQRQMKDVKAQSR